MSYKKGAIVKSEYKERETLMASSIGSYFGFGFREPAEQLAIDLGEIPVEFTEEELERMERGNFFEEAMLDFFEKKFGIKIKDRNTEVLEIFDGMLRVKVDGTTVYDGVPTLVEAKFSTASTGNFIYNKGYYMQCQAGMVAYGVEQALLLGFWNGKPYWRLIKRDEEVIKDMEAMASVVTMILRKEVGKDVFPFFLVDMYAETPVQKEEDFNEDRDLSKAVEFAENKVAIKTLEDRNKEIAAEFRETYESTKFKNDEVSVNIRIQKGRTSFKKDLLIMDHPDLDIEKYEVSGEPSHIVDIRPVKKKEK